jgi:DNA-binding MarR family transcriptional regulator
LWNQSKVLGISPIQIQILIFLHFHSVEKRKVGYMAQEFNMTKATVSEAVKSLEQKGLLERLTDPADTRSQHLHLTTAGRGTAVQTAMFANPMLPSLERLSATDRAALLENLLAIVARLQQAGIISLQRMCFACRFYQLTENNHFCHFLNKKLETSELRVDCAEFEAAP